MRFLTLTLLMTLISVLFVFTLSVRAYGDSFGSGANIFDIQFVMIGNPDNPADTTGYPNPAGSVLYTYRIGKFEISRDMVTKANSLGTLGITFDDRVINGTGPNKPALGISWNEAARFVNWLNTSTGNPPAYKFAFQPDQAGYNPNDGNLLWVPFEAGFDADNRYRNKLAKYFLPSVHEWYKAAYYDPAANVYYNFATGSNTPPIAVANGTAAGTAVWQHNQTGPANIMEAGGLSPYGTMAQNGNALDWVETEDDQVNDTPSNWRHVRGGTWFHFQSVDLESPTIHRTAIPSDQFGGFGFRVASTFQPPLQVLGDYNNDGTVDAADYVLWRNGGPLQNEGDMPGTVNQTDYDIWRSRYATTLGLGSSTVPEPAMWLLIALGLGLWPIRRRGRLRLASHH